MPVSSPMVAETAKLHENTFRAVNIALANELALMCDRLGISAWEVIDAAATKPFGFLPHYPGPGLGGDCIPVVPHFLAWRLREYGYSAQLIDAAHEVNAHMPTLRAAEDRATRSTTRPADQGLADPAARRGLQGRTSHDTRESPSLEVMRQLLARGGDVRYCDPWVAELELDDVRAPQRRVDCRGGRARPTASSMLTPHRQFLEQPLWEQRELDRRHAQRRPATGRTSTRI